MRPIDADAIRFDVLEHWLNEEVYCANEVLDLIDEQPTINQWHRVEEELPKEAGEYIVAYHPCWWNDVKTSVTEIGIDTFRGKTSWAKRKFQRVTHWMEKPEPPKEENDA